MLFRSKDPAFLSFEDGFDVMDLDPHKQSYHKTAEVHPVVRVIIFFVDNVSTFAQSPFTLLSSLIALILTNVTGTILIVLKTTLNLSGL